MDFVNEAEAKIDALIREELLELKQIYGRSDDRRSEIIAGEDALELEDMIAEEDMVITISHTGYIKRIAVSTYRRQRRGGRRAVGEGEADRSGEQLAHRQSAERPVGDV